MRLIAISIVILAGSIMAAAGTITEALPEVRRFNLLDSFGMIVVGLGLVLLLIELAKSWFPARFVPAESANPESAKPHVA